MDGSFFGGAASGILQIAVAVLLIWVALKFLKGMAKGIIFTVIGVGVFLVVKGVIDWAMIASVGEGLFEWIKQKIAESSANDISETVNGLIGFIK